jgi:hypothetical protein
LFKPRIVQPENSQGAGQGSNKTGFDKLSTKTGLTFPGTYDTASADVGQIAIEIYADEFAKRCCNPSVGYAKMDVILLPQIASIRLVTDNRSYSSMNDLTYQIQTNTGNSHDSTAKLPSFDRSGSGS